MSHVNITSTRVEDGGEYSCTFENRAGKTSHAARLNIYGIYLCVFFWIFTCTQLSIFYSIHFHSLLGKVHYFTSSVLFCPSNSVSFPIFIILSCHWLEQTLIIDVNDVGFIDYYISVSCCCLYAGEARCFYENFEDGFRRIVTITTFTKISLWSFKITQFFTNQIYLLIYQWAPNHYFSCWQ